MKYTKKFEREIFARFRKELGNLRNDAELTPRQKKNRIKKLNEKLEAKIKWLYELDNVEDLKEIEINTSWKRSSTWGWNPTCTVYINGKYAGEGKASGWGYDKESAAASGPIRNSDIVIKFLIKHYDRLKECYAVENWQGYPQIDVNSKGLETLRSLLCEYLKHDFKKIHKYRMLEEREGLHRYVFKV